LEADPSAGHAQATVSEVIKDLANSAPETAEDRFTQGGGAASIANRLRESGLIEWTHAFESQANLGQGLEPEPKQLKLSLVGPQEFFAAPILTNVSSPSHAICAK
jgi:hypothetical protein